MDRQLLVKADEENKIRRDDEILIVERHGQRLAFSVFQFAYHHIAQGELADHPYLVAFFKLNY
jgi:hypothetical protein